MSRPKKIPQCATAATFASGPDTGQPTRVELLTGEKSDGFHSASRPPAQKHNWLFGTTGDWIDYLADVGPLNWPTSIYSDTTPTILQLSSVRPDGSAAMYRSQYQSVWIVLGHSTAGHLYVFEFSKVDDINTAIASPVAFHCGAEALASGLPRQVVFNSALTTGGPVYAYSGAGTLATWTKSNLPGTYAVSQGQVLDAVTTGTGRIVAVGGGATNIANVAFGDLNAWTSSNGVTFTAAVVGSRVTVGVNLARIIVGKANRLVAWVNDTGGNGGNVLWYSDDDGSTWTARTGALTGVRIIDGCYSATDDAYYFIHDSNIEVITNLTTGVSTVLTVPGLTLKAVRELEGLLLLTGITTVGNRSFMVASRDGGVTQRIVQRNLTGSTMLAVDPVLGQFAMRSNGGSFGTAIFDRDAVSCSQRMKGML